MATHSSNLAWRIPWTEEPDGLQSIVSWRVGHDWATITHTYIYNRILFNHKNRAMLLLLITWMGLRALCDMKLVRQRKMLFYSVQFSLAVMSDCDPMDCNTPSFPVHHQLPKLAQTHVQRVGDAIQPSHSLSSLSPPPFNLSQHQGLFQWVSSSHQVIKVLGVSASASVLPVNIQDWFPLGWTGGISLQSKGLSVVFSNTTVQKHKFLSAQLKKKELKSLKKSRMMIIRSREWGKLVKVVEEYTNF